MLYPSAFSATSYRFLLNLAFTLYFFIGDIELIRTKYHETNKLRIVAYLVLMPFILKLVVMVNEVFFTEILPELKMLGLYWQYIPLFD
jgi:hypothetical protein